MKVVLWGLAVLLSIVSLTVIGHAQAKKLKIYISADMEGITRR